MTTLEWLQQFSETKRQFDMTRRCASAVVRVNLNDGSNFFAAGMSAGPGPAFLTVDVYPENPPEDMVEGTDGLPQTPTVVMVPLTAISKIELLTEAPVEHELGFRATES